MDVARLKSLLSDGGYTCIVSNGDDIYPSVERGIRPLVELIRSGINSKGFFAADKVVGKAAALLYAYMGVSVLYACVASADALKVCERYGISLCYDTLTENIINRKGDGLCPMELAVADIDDPETAYAAVAAKSAELMFAETQKERL